MYTMAIINLIWNATIKTYKKISCKFYYLRYSTWSKDPPEYCNRSANNDIIANIFHDDSSLTCYQGQ